MNGMPSLLIPAEHVRPGVDTVIERSERGPVVDRHIIVGKENCRTDPGNIHLLTADKTLCYYRQARVELL